MVFANVALRFFTDRSILWVEEASRYTMIWLTFIGAGLVLRYGGHIGDRHAAAAAAARTRRRSAAAIVVVLLGFFGTMTVVGLRYAIADLGARRRRCWRSRSAPCTSRCRSGSR